MRKHTLRHGQACPEGLATSRETKMKGELDTLPDPTQCVGPTSPPALVIYVQLWLRGGGCPSEHLTTMTLAKSDAGEGALRGKTLTQRIGLGPCTISYAQASLRSVPTSAPSLMRASIDSGSVPACPPIATTYEHYDFPCSQFLSGSISMIGGVRDYGVCSGGYSRARPD